MKLDRKLVLAALAKHRAELTRMGVRRLGLFGSFARDEARPDSDIDLAVEFEHKSFDGYMNLKFFLEDLFDRKVDLVLYDRIKPALRRNIEADIVDAA